MLARVATFNPLPEDVDMQAVELLRKTVREAPGFVAGYHLGAPGRKAMSIAIFEDEDGSRAAAAALGRRPAGQRVGIEPHAVELYEVQPF